MSEVSKIGGFGLAINGEVNLSELFAAKGLITVGPFMTESAASEYHAELVQELETRRLYASFISTELVDNLDADNDDVVAITFPNIIGEITKVEIVRQIVCRINPAQFSAERLSNCIGRLFAESIVEQIKGHEM
jgi:hypothetical protein